MKRNCTSEATNIAGLIVLAMAQFVSVKGKWPTSLPQAKIFGKPRLNWGHKPHFGPIAWWQMETCHRRCHMAANSAPKRMDQIFPSIKTFLTVAHCFRFTECSKYTF